MLTLVLCTKRKDPKFEWMADSLAAAAAKIKVEWEMICVDGCLWDGATQRVEQLNSAWLGAGLKLECLRHVEPKPTLWQGPHRLTSRDYFALCSARNTAFALARGEQCVFFDDCSVLDENFLKWHVGAASRGFAVAGGYKTYWTAEVEKGKILSGREYEHPDHRIEHSEYMPQNGRVPYAPGGWMWGLNFAVPTKVAVAINGNDERYDGQGGSEDCDFGVRIQRAGCPILYLKDCKVYQILETHDAVADGSVDNWDKQARKAQKERKLARDGQMHFANEYLIEELQDHDPCRITAKNEFSLRELRDLLAMGEDFPTPKHPSVDWRDGQRLETM